HYKMDNAERIALILALSPHVKPSLLDLLFVKNNETERGYTAFGGLKGIAHGGFIPTGETLMFLLAGTELNLRFKYMLLLEEGHFFSAHHVLTLMPAPNDEPALSGALKISREFLAQFTTGHIGKPSFSMDFPAKLITTALEWEDLVLPARTHEQIDEIKTWVTHSHTLMNEWGMSKKLKPGFKSLFFGPPGTGKTLTACLLGKQCGMDVYRIDLSMVISKYIGETEKNLSKIFDMAEDKNWILFFDEAEALFGKRTGVSDAHDRFANQEVSYLLQRIEDFNGVVILASNLKSNIDDAFTRRFQSVIYFPVPAPEQRYQLWDKAFPDSAGRDEKINLKEIAFKYELTGGTIMNIIRYSSLMTLKRNENTITFNDIQQGIKREYLKEGKIIT
ncbi:MAG: ATP-binding protein, partial [Ferruginibacter sp.]|nr:ATP-binding protein [Ferruginibacter sp.]